MLRRCTVMAFAATLTFSLAACGPKTMQAKIREGERLSDRATEALDDAAKALQAYELDRAEDRLRDAEDALSRPEINTNPESELLKSRFEELKAKIPAAREELARREIAKKVAARREIISKSLTAFRKALLESERKLDRAAVQEARDAARQVTDDIEWDKGLQEKDSEFKAYVEGIRQDLASSEQELSMTERTIEFLEGPLKDHDDAAARADQARTEKNLDVRLEHFKFAVDHFRQCDANAQKMIQATAALENAAIEDAGKPTTPGKIARACATEAKRLEVRLAATQKAVDAAAKKAARAAEKAARAAEKAAKKGKRGK